MKNYIGIILLLIAGIIGCTKQTKLTEEEVIYVIKQFDDGWRNKNFKKVDPVLSPVYIYFTQSGGRFSRDSLVQTAGSNTYLLQSMDRCEIVVALYENTAVVSTRWLGKGIYRGIPFDEDQRCSVTVIKKDNKVQILSEHCTPIRFNKQVFH